MTDDYWAKSAKLASEASTRRKMRSAAAAFGSVCAILGAAFIWGSGAIPLVVGIIALVDSWVDALQEQLEKNER
jgi:hypothetical protein